MNQLKIAVGYLRCSTDMQAETSPEQQKEIISEWASKTGYRVIDWYIDVGKSGTSFEKRPEFVRLLNDVQNKPNFEAVIVLDESRWGRAGADDSIYYKTLFKKKGNVNVVMVRTIANTGNPTFDTMLGAFEGGLSHEESKKKSERTYDGCLSAIRSGHSSGGTAPYGYRRVAVNRFSGATRLLGIVYGLDGMPALNTKGLVLSEQIRPKEEYVVWEPGEPEEVKTVKRIFEWRVKHRYGYAKIAKMLNAEKVPCPRRGKWGLKDQKWSSGTIGSIIRNPTYMGARVYGRLKKRGIGKFAPRYWVKDPSEWTVIENSHPPIVSSDTWKAANPTIENREKGRRAVIRFDSPYLLSGLIKCSKCGFNFAGQSQTIGPPKSRKKRRTYADSAYINKGPSVCSSMSIDAEKLENAVTNVVFERSSKDDIRVKFQRKIDDYLARWRHTPHEEMERVQTGLLKTKNRIVSYMALADKGVNLGEVADRLKTLQSERESLESALERLRLKSPAREKLYSSIEEAVKFYGGFQRHFEEASVSERKTLIRQVVQSILIDREKQVAKCYLYGLPKQIAENLLQTGTTRISDVPPTRFELVFQA